MHVHGRPSRRQLAHERRQRLLSLALIVLAGLAFPLMAHWLAGLDEGAALILPTVVLTGAICMVSTSRIIPPVAVIGMYLVEWASQSVRSRPIGESVLMRLLEGRIDLLWVPLAAVLLGYLLVYARRIWRPVLIPPSLPTNLHVLARRPVLFVRKYWPAILLLAVATVLDGFTTIRFMQNNAGPINELHPGVRTAAEVYGVVPGVIVGQVTRFGFAVFVAAIWRKTCAALMILLGVLYSLAALSNHFGWL